MPSSLTKAESLLGLARRIIVERAPYLIPTLYKLIPVFTEELRTMAVTKRLVLLLNPKYVERYTPELIAGALMHECGHVTREHWKRVEHFKMDPDGANIAGDKAINSTLKMAGWKLPGKPYYPEDFGQPTGRTMEEYYALDHAPKPPAPALPQPTKVPAQQQPKPAQPPPPTQVPSQDPSIEDHEDDSDGQGQGTAALPPAPPSPGQDQQDPSNGGTQNPDQTNERAPAPHATKAPKEVGQGRCGGIAGNPVQQELEDRMDELYGRSEVERDLAVKETKKAIQSFIAEKGRGSVPGEFLEELYVEEEPPKVPWQRTLHRFLQRATGLIEYGGRDFSLSRPTKRSFGRMLLRPGLVQRKLNTLIEVDTSGSMGTKELNTVFREVIGIIRRAGLGDIYLQQIDCSVQTKPERINIRDVKNIQIFGRGGTDFKPAFVEARKMRPRPDLMIYFTDGDGDAPKTAPKEFPVIWVLVGSYTRKPADWGLTVRVET